MTGTTWNSCLLSVRGALKTPDGVFEHALMEYSHLPKHTPLLFNSLAGGFKNDEDRDKIKRHCETCA